MTPSLSGRLGGNREHTTMLVGVSCHPLALMLRSRCAGPSRETQNLRSWCSSGLGITGKSTGTPRAATSLDLVVLGVATGAVVMRYVFGFLCVCALSVVPVLGCSETAGTGGTGGGGVGGAEGECILDAAAQACADLPWGNFSWAFCRKIG